MSHFYLIFSLDENVTGWRMDPERLRTAYRKRWPNAEPYPEALKEGEVEWSVDVDEAVWFNAHLAEDGSRFVMHGFLEPIADAACWYRALVPPEERLFLSDSTYSHAMLLPPGTTPEQIIDHFLHGPTTGEQDPLTGQPYPPQNEPGD